MKQLTIKDAVVYLALRMPAELRNRVAKYADDGDISLNRAAIELIEAGLACES